MASILVRSSDDGGGILWFGYGWMIPATIAFYGSHEFTSNSRDAAEWSNLKPQAQRVIEAILPLLPDPGSNNILVNSKRFGVDLGAREPWTELFPEIVRIIRNEIGDVDVEMNRASHHSTSAWLAGLIDSL
jgi:hypothetical protein